MGGNSAYTPYVNLTGTAAGTVVVLSHPGNFTSYVVGTATTGTVSLYDSSGTAQGTVNPLFTTTGGTQSLLPMTYVKNGILAVVSGTINALVSCG